MSMSGFPKKKEVDSKVLGRIEEGRQKMSGRKTKKKKTVERRQGTVQTRGTSITKNREKQHRTRKVLYQQSAGSTRNKKCLDSLVEGGNIAAPGL